MSKNKRQKSRVARRRLRAHDRNQKWFNRLRKRHGQKLVKQSTFRRPSGPNPA